MSTASESDELEAFYEFAARLRENSPEEFSLEQCLYEYRLQREWKPQTELGKLLKEQRAKFVAEGGKLLTAEEVEQEVRERRGGLESFEP